MCRYGGRLSNAGIECMNSINAGMGFTQRSLSLPPQSFEMPSYLLKELNVLQFGGAGMGCRGCRYGVHDLNRCWYGVHAMTWVSFGSWSTLYTI